MLGILNLPTILECRRRGSMLTRVAHRTGRNHLPPSPSSTRSNVGSQILHESARAPHPASGYVGVVASRRVYLLLLLLAAVAFVSSFAIARALRDEPSSEPVAPPQVVDSMTPEHVDLGPAARLPPLRAQPPPSVKP